MGFGHLLRCELVLDCIALLLLCFVLFLYLIAFVVGSDCVVFGLLFVV